MKTFNLFLLVILFTCIFNKSAFSQEQNCEEAKKKYLIENPDVAKANLDAWFHYTYYGKKEGRKWPDCSNITQNVKTDKNLGVISKPITADTGKLAETLKYALSLGEKSALVGNFYNLQYVHQEFEFYDDPLAVLDAKIDASLGSEYAKAEKIKLDNILKGYLELKRQDSLLTEKLKKYGNCLMDGCETRIKSYQRFNKSTTVINFGQHWMAYQKKLKKLSFFIDDKNHIVFKIPKIDFPMSIDNLNIDNCKKLITSYYDDMENQDWKEAPSIEEKRTVEYCVCNFKGGYPKLKDKIDRMMAPTSTRAAYRIKHIDDFSKISKYNPLYYYHINNDYYDGYYRIKDKQSKVIDKAILKHPEIVLSKEEGIKTIELLTGLDEAYFELSNEKAKIDVMIKLIEKYLFVQLPKRDNSLGQFLYIGNTSKNIPNGYGYLINEKKQLIAVGYWDEGFPILLYNVNLYQNPGKVYKDYTYYADAFSKKYANKHFYLSSHSYKEHDLNSFSMYLGDFVYFSKENTNHRDGYGCNFFSDFNKTNAQYYQGYWSKGVKHGKGMHHGFESDFKGEFANDEITFGTVTNRNDKSVYTGFINKWKITGFGKKVYANGKVEDGYFENGYYKMNKNQYQEEMNKKEQERLAEESKRQELENPISNHHEFIKKRCYAIFGFMVLNDEKSMETESRLLFKDLEKDKLKRSITKKDQEYVLSVLDEIKREEIQASQINKYYESRDNRTCTCKWCSKTFKSDGYDIDKFNGKCGSKKGSGKYGVYGPTCDDYCSPKCATEACWSK